MTVALKWITPDAERMIVDCARVSSDPAKASRPDADLLRYLLRHKHFSPFEMSSACFEVVTTRDIARQILRHRSFSFQEFCVAEGTLVTTQTASGTKKVPIETLFAYQSDPRMARIWERGIRVFDEASRTFVRSRIKEVFKTGVKPVFKVRLEDGKQITCTDQHRFFTRDGFARLSDLQVGDLVAVNGVYAYRDAEWLAEAKARHVAAGAGINAIAAEAMVSYHTIRKWLKVHGLQFTKRENAIVAGGAWNKGLPKDKQPRYQKPVSEQTREKHRGSARKGKESNLYVNGASADRSRRVKVSDWQQAYRLEVLDRSNHQCAECTATECLEIDHIIPVSADPSLAYCVNNLQALCRDCHRKKSTAETVAARKTVRWKEIISIERAGEAMTYDLEVEHTSHNYVANGIVTHNSQRYEDVDVLTAVDMREARMQHPTNRQASTACQDDTLRGWWLEQQAEVHGTAMDAYRQAMARGIAKEVARAVLPEGLTASRMFMSGTIRSWLHFIEVRTDAGAQAEVQAIARAVSAILSEQIPAIMEARA